MNGNELLKEIGNLDNEYIAEAADALQRKKKIPYMKYLSVAATLILVFAAVSGSFGNMNIARKMDNTKDEGIEYHSFANETEITSSLPLYGMEDTGDASFSAVASVSTDNGTFILSDSLKYLMDKYRETARYRVKVLFYSNHEGLSNYDSLVQADLERLNKEGYITAVEKYEEPGYVVTHITLHATYEQLINFSAAENLGYYLTLFGNAENVVSYNSGIKQN